MSFEKARFNMVQQQVRPWNVLDETVLHLLSTVPREHFVPEDYQSLAFSDCEIPIASEQVMLAPKVVGRILQALKIKSNHTVLEIGTGTGYLTALLAKMASKVVSVEIMPELHAIAKHNLENIENIQLEAGDAMGNWHTNKVFEAIAITGSVPKLPGKLRNLLAPQGKLFAFLGKESPMTAILVTRIGDDEFHTDRLFETYVPPLINAPEIEKFVF